jgi:hypothetical protein
VLFQISSVRCGKGTILTIVGYNFFVFVVNMLGQGRRFYSFGVAKIVFLCFARQVEMASFNVRFQEEGILC